MDAGEDERKPLATRFLTALIYLNDGFGGGETNFPMAGPSGTRRPQIRNVHVVRREFNNCQTSQGLTLAPQMGRVVIFHNTHPNSAGFDFHAWHGSCAVAALGEKWAANMWFSFGLFHNAREELRTT